MLQSLDQTEGSFTNYLFAKYLIAYGYFPTLPVSQAKCLWEKERQGGRSEAQEKGQWVPDRALRSLLRTFFACTIGWSAQLWKRGPLSIGG